MRLNITILVNTKTSFYKNENNMKRFFLILYCFANFSLGKAQTIDTLISVGNHKLHFNIIMGKGMPILFEAGNGDDATVWQSIVTQVYNQTNATIITYDRAGLGKSEIDKILKRLKVLFVLTLRLHVFLQKIGRMNSSKQ